MNVSVSQTEAIQHASSSDLIVAGVVGYRLRGNPTGTVADFIGRANAQTVPILALDASSGVDTA